MKILHVIHSVDPRSGGTIEGVRQVSAALVALGHEVDVLSLDDPAAPWLRGFPLTVFAMGPSRGNYGYSPRVVPWLVNNGPSYQAILVNGLWQYGSLATWFASRRTMLPYFVFPHGMLDPWFKQHYPLKHLKKWLYWPWAEYRVLRDAKAVLFTAEDERIRARESFWLYQCREEVLGYGIAPPPADVPKQLASFLALYPKLAGKHILLFLGRLHEKKGCDLLLRAFHQALLRGDSSDLHLVMAGPCDPAYESELRSNAKMLGIEDQMTWTSMLSGDAKWGAFRAASAFILPSHQENFGVSVVEALACGVPVLISNKVNIWREVIGDGAGIVEHDNFDGTSSLVNHWLALSDIDKQKMREAAKRCYDNHFQVSKIAQHLISLLVR